MMSSTDKCLLAALILVFSTLKSRAVRVTESLLQKNNEWWTAATKLCLSYRPIPRLVWGWLLLSGARLAADDNKRSYNHTYCIFRTDDWAYFWTVTESYVILVKMSNVCAGTFCMCGLIAGLRLLTAGGQRLTPARNVSTFG